MKKMWVTGSAVLFAMTLSTAWAQAPAAKADPKVHECRVHNQKEHKEVMAIHAKGMKEHKINSAEEKGYRAMEKRLHAHQATLAKGGLTLAECEQIGKEIAREKAAVTQMASAAQVAPKADPKVHECRAHNQKEHAAIMAMHAKGIKEHKVNSAEEKEFRAMEKRLHAHQATLAKGGLTLAECHQLTKELNHERAEVAKITASAGPSKGPVKK